ncbi:MAG: hypothetical protein GX330_04025 [Bacteroidales bacterium]|nr:hypothetical protein [Bacteroidales bacterium]
MKAVFISFYQAFYDEVIEVLDKHQIKGFTSWNEVLGRGSDGGEPHYGTHAWPTINSAIITFIADDKVKPLLKDIHALDLTAPMQGIRAFVLQAEEYTDKDV